jgi:radical SAM protein with 4Fe4S-binding SPASM domain
VVEREAQVNSASVEVLPILNNQEQSSSGKCGCGTGPTPEQAYKLSELQKELQNVLDTTRTGPAFTPVALNQPPVEANSNSAVFSMHNPVPLVSQIVHRDVDGKHMWLGVLEAAIMVLNDEQHQIMESLVAGKPPLVVAREIAGGGPPAWDRVSTVIGKMARSGFVSGIRGYVEERPATPERFSRFHLTKACQLECIHCYADSSPHVDRSNELPTERWQKLAIDFGANGGESILFTGGEALMHKGCLEIMATVKNAGMKVTLFSNGILIPKFAKEIHPLVDSVQISLDGPDAASNDLIRGTNTYKKIIKAIDILVAQGTPTRIGMSVMLQNWESWKVGFLDFAARYANTSVEFRLSFGLTHYGRAEGLAPISVKDVQPIAAKFMEQMNGTTGPKITRITKGCGYCEQLVVGPDGTVYPCHLLDAPMCNIDDYPVPDLIGILKRTAGKFDVDHVEGCNRCEIRYLCGGTCRVLDSHQTGTRLITTCNADEKGRKLRNLARTYSQ